jgi:hypothetical protein
MMVALLFVLLIIGGIAAFMLRPTSTTKTTAEPTPEVLPSEMPTQQPLPTVEPTKTPEEKQIDTIETGSSSAEIKDMQQKVNQL